MVKTVERWGLFELFLEGEAGGNPFVDVPLRCEFRKGHRNITIDGFYDGDGRYGLRFMPEECGLWEYRISFRGRTWADLKGSFLCTEPSPGNHGPVRVSGPRSFAYGDGTPFHPLGTTAYAWTHQGADKEEETLDFLEGSCFNKIRMCLFPQNFGPWERTVVRFPFARRENGAWDYDRFDPLFFRHLEKRIGDLGKRGVEADLILFHPYDAWGFSRMSPREDRNYLRYVVARFSAYRHVWWSLANEYDLIREKSLSDWDELFKAIQEYDPHIHLRSIHNYLPFYDHGKPWVSHVTVQRTDWYKTAEFTDRWQREYNKPVIQEEFGYEGDFSWNWGNLTGQEFIRRAWESLARGGYFGHGEAFLKEGPELAISQGGAMSGDSLSRLEFMKREIFDRGILPFEPVPLCRDETPSGKFPGGFLVYLGGGQPRFKELNLPEGKEYAAEVLDTWNMTVERLPGSFRGFSRIEPLGRPYLALRMTEKDKESLD